MKKFMTVPEAAAEMGITPRALWLRIYRGQFPCKRWGRRVLVDCVELARFCASLPGISADEAAKKIKEVG